LNNLAGKKFIFLYIIIILLTFSTLKAQAEFIILGDPWPPWTSENYGPAQGGIAVDFAYKLFENAGIKIQIHLHPWKRVIRMIQYGQADGILMTQPSKELSEFIHFTEPVFSGKEVICFNKVNTPDFKWNSFNDLKNFTIGTILGYNYGNFSSAKENLSLKTVESQNLISNIKKLVMGRIDLVICDFAALNTILNNNPELKNSISISEKPLYEWKYSIGISKFSELFDKREDIDRLIIKMKKQS